MPVSFLDSLTALLSDGIMGKKPSPVNYMLSLLLKQITSLPDSDQLNQFVTYVSQRYPALTEQLEKSITNGIPTKEKADLIATMATTQSVILSNEYKRFQQDSRDDLFDDPSTRQQDIRVSNRLRARYFLPGDEVGKETPEQTASDLTQVSLFQYRIPNADAGGNNNSIYLDNRRNDALRFSGDMGHPMPPDRLMENVLPFAVRPQYATDQPLMSIFREKLINNMATRVVVTRLGKNSVGLMDQINGNILEPVITLPGPFRSSAQTSAPMKSSASSYRDNNEPVMTGEDITMDENNNPIYTL